MSKTMLEAMLDPDRSKAAEAAHNLVRALHSGDKDRIQDAQDAFGALAEDPRGH